MNLNVKLLRDTDRFSQKAARYEGTDQEFVEAIIRAHGEVCQLSSLGMPSTAL